MRVERTTQDAVTVISLMGDLDGSTATQIAADVAELLPPDGPLLLDFSGICSVSSAGLRALLLLYRRARRQRRRFVLAAVPADMSAVLSETGFTDSLVLAETVAAGVRALNR
jgi:anti-sigma B factor antagonist